MYITDDLRNKFLKFFALRGHKVFPSDSLIPKNDPTLLFTSAGMNQFKDYFLGKLQDTKRATSCQRCLRTGDLEKVGKTDYHHTFFEMLGNFSFGDYFKKEAISWAWEFLTKELGLNEERLWVSVYKEDEEAYQIWQKSIGIKKDRIIRLGAEDNFWPANAPQDGPDGPCGPCSEIFFDWGKARGCGRPDCSPAHSCGRFTEIWNLVFTQFNRQGKNNLVPLPAKNIDTGMGLERLSAVAQGKFSNFDIDSFLPLKEEVAKFLKNSDTFSINAIVDHIRAIVFSIFDGIYPSNEDRGYVVRRLIRRALWFGFKAGRKKPFLYKLPPLVAEVMKEAYGEVKEKREYIAEVILKEEERFLETLERGRKILFSFFAAHKTDSHKKLEGEFVFRLYDTYGFPFELTKTIAAEEGFLVQEEEFQRLVEEQRERSRQGSKFEDSVFAKGDMKINKSLKPTVFVGYENLSAEAEVVDVEEEGEKNIVVLDQTPFYPTSGGQMHDKGRIKNEKAVFIVEEVFKNGEVIFHKGYFEEDSFEAGDKVGAEVDSRRRMALARAHTATHLLQAALRKVLGEHIQQQGSLVDEDYFRFDFSHFKKLSAEELKEVELLVNDYIASGWKVEKKIMSRGEAKRKGALAFFEEKYGEKVRVVSISDVSCELCGGTHLDNTSQALVFLVVSESSIASGIRRIEAQVGKRAQKLLLTSQESLKEVISLLHTDLSQLTEKVNRLIEDNKRLQRRNYVLRWEVFEKVTAVQILSRPQKVKGFDVFVFRLKDADSGFLRQAIDLLRKQKQKALFLGILEQRGKILFNIAVASDLNRIDCGYIAKRIGTVLGGSGGGKKDFAFGGIKEKLSLDKIKQTLQEVLHEVNQG